MADVLAFDAWAWIADSKTAVVTSNTKSVPNLPCWGSRGGEAPQPRIDGKWGMAEYSIIPQLYDVSSPYLAWMPTHRFTRLGFSTAVNSFRVIEEPANPNAVFVRHPGWKHRGYLHTEIREKLQMEVVRYIELVKDIIQSEANPKTRKGPAEVRPPVIALVRAHSSVFCMRFPHLTYRDLVEYVAGLQRSVAELQAYIMWYDRIQYGDVPASTRSFELGLRGTVAQSVTDYNTLRKLGVPVWLALPSSNVALLDAAKRVTPQLISVETRTWDDMPISHSLRDTYKGKLVHNKPLEYYPPLVDNWTTYEPAARGYSPRLDVVHRDLSSLRDVLAMVRTVSECFFAVYTSLRLMETPELSGKNHNKSAALALEVREAGEIAAELIQKYGWC